MSEKTTSFDKMLRQYQGTLPDISDTNFLIQDNAAESVNQAIDEATRDHAQWTERAVQLSQDLEKNKTDPWKELTSLVKPLAALHEAHKTKQKQKALIESFKKKRENRIQGTIDDKLYKSEQLSDLGEGAGIDAAEYGDRVGWSDADKDWLIKNGYWDAKTDKLNEEADFDNINKYLIEKDRLGFEAQVNQAQRLQEEATNLQLSVDQRLQLILNSSQFNEAASAYEIGNDMIVDAPYTINALLGVKKQFPGMDRPLSYLDATSEYATAAEAAWAGELMQDAIADYMTANANKIDKIGERYFREEVFPKIYEHAQSLHKKTLNETLNNAKAQNAKKNVSILSSNLKTYGIRALTGPTGMVTIQELQADGTRNNTVGWNRTFDMLEKGLIEGELDAGDLEGILDEPFMGRDGKMTNLEKLKPHFYKRLYTLKEKYRKDEAVSEEKQFRAAVVAARDQLYEATGGKLPSSRDALDAVQKLAQEWGRTSSNPAFDDLNRIIAANDNDPKAIDFILRGQYAKKNRLLDETLIERLPEGSPERIYWENKAKERGIGGISDDKLEDIKTEGKEKIKDFKDIDDINKRIYAKERKAVERIPEFFNSRYNYHLRTASRKPGFELDAGAKDAAMKAAHADLEDAIYSLGTAQENQQLYGPVVVPKYEEGLEQDHAQFVQFLIANPKLAKDDDLYYNSTEETAILQGIEAQKNGEILPDYWNQNAPYYNMSPRDLFNRRKTSTAELRDGEDDPTEDEEKYRLLKPISIKPNQAKTAQHILEKQNVDQMILDLQRDDAEVNSTFRTTTTDQEATLEGIENMTLMEILNLRTLPNWNDDIGIGLYDLKFSALAQLLTEPGLAEYIGFDSVFNEETQKKLIYARMIQKGNQAGSTKSWDNQYRRLKWLTDEEIENFKTIIQKIQGQETYKDDPFNSLNLLSDEVAKAALEDAMSYA